MQVRQDRRHFLTSASLAAAAGVLGSRAPLADDGPPETATVRLLRDPGCGAPVTLAAELVRAAGFSEVRLVDFEIGSTDVQMLMKGTMDIGVAFATDVVRELDAGTPIAVLAGMHPGCQELFVHEPVTGIKDLQGRRVAAPEFDYSVRLLLSVMMANIGLDASKDIDWVADSTPSPMDLFLAGEADASFALPPQAQELHSRGIGRVILNTSIDPPWSQYFCCLLVSRKEFVDTHPVATKRLLRAILKATDMCAAQPQWAASRLVESASARYDYALEMMGDLPYGRWREYEPEDTLRFFALRLHEFGMVTSNPNTIIANGADWRFLNELKRELKG